MLPLVALIALSRHHTQDVTLPDTLPARRLGDLVTAFNSKDPAIVGAMVANNFAKSELKLVSKDEWVSRIIEAGKDLAPIAVVSVLRSADYSIVVKLKGNTNLPLGMRVDLEPDQPFGVIDARLGAPNSLLSLKPASKYAAWDSLDQLAAAVAKDYKLPALFVAYQRQNEAPQEAVVGTRSLTRRAGDVTVDDRVLVGGIGEAMTATMIARLIELKKLDWGTTLGQVLSTMPMQEGYKSVTVEQLINHRSGIPGDAKMTDAELEQAAAKAQSPTDYRKAYVKSILSREPISPVTQSIETKADYVVLGYLAENLIHQSYEYLMDRYVFGPMKITTALIAPVGSDGQFGSGNNVYGHLMADLGYTAYAMPPTEMDYVFAPAGAGMSLSVGDILVFAEFHLKGMKGEAKVLTAESYKRLHTVSEANAGDVYVGGWMTSPPNSDEPYQYQAGTDGSFFADMTIWPENSFAIVAVTNAGTIRRPPPTMEAITAIKEKLEKKY